MRISATRRSVTVATALKSLVPDHAFSAPVTTTDLPKISSPIVHQADPKKFVVVPPHSAPPPAKPHVIKLEPVHGHRGLDWKVVALSTATAIGLAALFVWPQFSAPNNSFFQAGGDVLGSNITAPLRVTVTVVDGNGRRQVETQPQTGILLESVARAANDLHTSFLYESRGNSAYLKTFADQANDETGRWIVRHNGQEISDLNAVTLAQGDSVRLERQGAGQ